MRKRVALITGITGQDGSYLAELLLEKDYQVHGIVRRGQEFVTRKITSRAVKIKLRLADSLPLGNLEARRDWGHAREYVKAMWLMLQQAAPSDYVIATGETHSVREFAETAFRMLQLDYREYGPSTAICSGRRKPTSSRATHPAQDGSSAGPKASLSRNWCARWSTRTSSVRASKPPGARRRMK